MVAPLALAAGVAVAQSTRATLPDPVLDRLVAEALASTPEIASARAAVEAARRRITPAATLPDPFLGTTYQNDGNDLSLGESEDSFVGLMVSQPLPWPGKLSLAGRTAESEASELEAGLVGRRQLAIEARVRNAWYDLAIARAIDRIIEDRREGFLQGVLVAPIPRWAMMLGKVIGGTLVALFQGLIFLVLGLMLPIAVTPAGALQLVLLLFVASLAITSLGAFFAWKTDSTQGFHAIMNLVLMPLWLLSGAFFPAPQLAADASVSQWLLGAAMRINPLSYAVGGARRLLFDADYGQAWVPSLTEAWVVTLVFAVVAFAGACWVSGRRTTADLL